MIHKITHDMNNDIDTDVGNDDTQVKKNENIRKKRVVKRLVVQRKGEKKIVTRRVELLPPAPPTSPEVCVEHTPDFVHQTMLTCIGNKRTLVDEIWKIADGVREKLGKDKLVVMDGFSGSSVVGRKLSALASKVYANDMEKYAYMCGVCSLRTPSPDQRTMIGHHIKEMNQLAVTGPYVEGFVTKYYAPRDTENIQKGERCFYTRENALIIDTLRAYVARNVPLILQTYCMVPLITKASIHANTSGVFKGFHSENGVGKWGGAAARCLPRIKGRIELEVPVWSSDEFAAEVFQGDVNVVIKDKIGDDELDLLYLDPPYNQHPYGSNYFMLNLIGDLIGEPDPEKMSRVSGIVNDWTRSNYNYRDKAIKDMTELLKVGLRKSQYVLISYNDEGLIEDADWTRIFTECGCTVALHEIKYNAYRGSRNLAGRSDKVMERMYLCSREA
jgi:adenine-specific DNA-methyltransferase